ncbi:hypothetical protein FRC03_008352 [Tulasnella sp. 419]|nr:hypothetical protein FRC03_008352 [Tulasnella sp. 419]
MARRLAAGLAFLPAFVRSFSFSYSAPTQCGPFTVSWEGGSPPFTLQLTPIFDTPRYFNIPGSSFSNNKGSFTFPLPVASQKTFLVTMSDGTGFGTGGTSDILTAADPVNGATCNTTSPKVDFDFQLNTALQQCRPYTIDAYTAAQQPVSILGLIPLGNSFVLSPPVGPSSYTWTTNIKGGTRLIIVMTDSQGRQGGSSDLLITGASDDSSCINSNSPGSTANSGPTVTIPSSTTISSSSSSASSLPSSGGSNGGAIAGGIIGGIAVLLALAALAWFLLRRKRRAQDSPHISTNFGKRHNMRDPQLDMNDHDHDHERGADGLEPVPYMLPSTAATDGVSRGPPTAYSDSTGTDYPPGRESMVASTDYNPQGQPVAASTQRSSKYSEAYSSTRGQPPNVPTRFVLHTDGGAVPQEQDEEDEVVELPPQYTSLTGNAARRPSQRHGPQNDAGGSSSAPGPS